MKTVHLSRIYTGCFGVGRVLTPREMIKKNQVRQAGQGSRDGAPLSLNPSPQHASSFDQFEAELIGWLTCWSMTSSANFPAPDSFSILIVLYVLQLL